MCTISYEPQLRRLRITGSCGDGDRGAIIDAVASSAAGEETLTIDLTAATEIDASVAAAIIAARDDPDDVRRITVLRRHDSAVDRQLQAAEHPTTHDDP